MIKSFQFPVFDIIYFIRNFQLTPVAKEILGKNRVHHDIHHYLTLSYLNVYKEDKHQITSVFQSIFCSNI